MEFTQSNAKVSALLNPRNVVVVGASEREGSWPATVWRTLHEYGFEKPVYAINPNRSTIFGKRCYRDFDALPESPDHLVILVQNHLVPDLLRQGAAAGARSATIYSSGFGEAGTPEGRSLERHLQEVLSETDIAITGPNCTGVIVGAERLVTMVDHRALQIGPGPVALVGQSGGVMLYANHVLTDRGIQIGYLISTGNESGLASADHIAFLAGEPSVKVIFCYAETIKDPVRFKRACELAQAAGKPVIVFKLGMSSAGREAAATHTGKLAGSAEVFDAVTSRLGVIRISSLDDAIELIELIVHWGLPVGRRTAALSLSGAFRGILLDAAADSAVEFRPLSAATEAELQRHLSTGSRVGNPADGGFSVLTDFNAYCGCIEALCADPEFDLVLLQAELPREPGMAAHWEERFAAMDAIAARHRKKVAVVSVYSRMFTDYTRQCRKELPHLAFVQEARKTVRAISDLVQWSELAEESRTASPWQQPERLQLGKCAASLWEKASALEAGGRLTISEPDAKALLNGYGIASALEKYTTTLEEAIRAADQLAYPVVLKPVVAELIHKSDLGVVKLGITGPDMLRDAYQEILTALERAKLGHLFQGMLVSEQIVGGIELVLGLHRDEELGLVAMIGAGGTLAELTRDVAFLDVPVNPSAATAALGSTRVSRLLAGYRGSAKHDSTRVVDALIALGRLAADFGDMIQSVDVNPLLSRAGDQNPVALDAVVVLRNPRDQ